MSWPNDLIRYALILFKKDGPMYWYKAQVLESYFGNAFVDNLKAFKSLPVDLRSYKTPSPLIATGSLSEICTQCKDVYSIKKSI